MPKTGAHNFISAVPLKVNATTIVRVTRVVRRADPGSSSVASSSRANTTDANVIERIIITVPLTIGVTTLRSRKSHLEMTSWKMAEAMISVASVAGPPSTTAVMQKGMAKAAVNMGRTALPPTGPAVFTWISVDSPTTSSDANTIQMR